eukprot:TRINITY_DN32014_c0_g1_i1.p1 TRINITY_DN32014_c0_g1~~TRINITY_DN32014_c0_g1_i1.p1  ORF type:complete len:517 (+),score=152.84 TRINITY_DN32014_c0_g1_i1:82-1551(+)
MAFQVVRKQLPWKMEGLTGRDQPRVLFGGQHEGPSLEELEAAGNGFEDMSTLRRDATFRSLGDTPEKRSAAVNERMLRMAPWVTRAAGDGQSFSPDHTAALASVSQDVQRYLVRVKSIDTDTGDLEVEGVAGKGSGKLDMRKVSDFVAYPGKIMGVTGRKLNDHMPIEVVSLLDALPLPIAPRVPKDKDGPKRVRAEGESARPRVRTSAPLSVVVAAGPFGSTPSQTRQMLQELVRTADARAASAVVVVGPLVAEREFDGTSYDEDWAELESIAGWLNGDAMADGSEARAGSGGRATVTFVPSPDDVFHDFVFPQPIYDGNLTPGQQLPNPAVFRIGDVSIGVCSADIVRHLKQRIFSRAEVSAVSLPPGRARHVIKQAVVEVVRSHSFYPLIPGHAELPLEYSKEGLLHFPGGVTPDVLILASSVPSFMEPIAVGEGERCLVLNPGRFSIQGTPTHSFVELRVSGGDTPLYRRTTAQWMQCRAHVPTP